MVEAWGTDSTEPWSRDALADPLQNMIARTCVSPFRPGSPHVVSCAVEVGRKGGAGPATHPVMHFRRPQGRSGPSFLGAVFFVLEVAALCLEHGLGLLPGCLVPWCRLGLRPLLVSEFFVGVWRGADVVAATRSTSVSVTSGCEVHVCLCFC